MISNFDTVRVEEISKDLIKYADEYTDLINAFFKRLDQVPNITKEWIGNQANYYFNHVALEKKKYIKFGNLLRNIPIKLTNDSAEISNHLLKQAKKEQEATYNDKI
ncbi:MAG: hypothetical protein IKX00_04660 [Bacilli bacterium]|nr:hypothetical protein [Bacilli bacterium]